MVNIIDELIEDMFASERSPAETTVYLNELADKILKDGRYTGYELKRCLYNTCLDKNICPECGVDLATHTYKEKYEAWGIPITENVTYKYCQTCGWEE